jgi:hypothetical protein
MKSPEEIEAKIREQRIVEANKKGFVGQTGKIGTVLKIFGQPIISQYEGGVYVDTNYFNEQQYEEMDPKNNSELMTSIPIFDMGNNERPSGEEWQEMPDPKQFGSNQIGLHFDGLSRGMHMEIKYDELEGEIVLSYKGYIAYKEIKGEIVSYVPNKEWEQWIENLYQKAQKMQRKLKEEEFESQMQRAEKKKKEWWREIISRWGIE